MIELTDLTPEHVQQQVETIKWFRDMDAIFNKNASDFETYKSEFEEHLQHVTKKLVSDIDDLIPKMTVINDMTDTEKFREYERALKNMMEQLHCFQDYVAWINKEEKLFKMNISRYPVVEELIDFVTPFLELIS